MEMKRTGKREAVCLCSFTWWLCSLAAVSVNESAAEKSIARKRKREIRGSFQVIW
jgi:hypothetical protein